jgi:hypothetical protein
MLKDVQIYEAMLGFFLTLIITLVKNNLMNKKSVPSKIIFIGAIGWTAHYMIRKILTNKYKQTNSN